MTDTMSRRDFLNGVALTIAAGLTPMVQLAAAPLHYPPGLTGLRGQHDGALETAHAFAREGRVFDLTKAPIKERYDLVVVGGGISGLAAAWFYRRKMGGHARILILDNHDDFGGHAKRNEFSADGRLILGYGGSETMQSPKTMYSKVARQLVSALGVKFERFETAFDRKFYPARGLSRGVFLPRDHFGRDVLAPGDPTTMVADELGPGLLNAKPVRDFVAAFPISEASKTQMIALYESKRDLFPGKSADDIKAALASISYRDFLIKLHGCAEEVANCFQGRTLDYFALGIDSVSAWDARATGYPGFGGISLPDKTETESEEPYIHHFPDGNASLARLLVRSLIPGVAPGRTMDDVVLAPFDYGKLDRDGSRVRLRLNATCINVSNTQKGAELVYVRDGKVERVAARHAVLACFNMIIPHLMPELPQAQREALAQNVKAPLVYSKVAVKNWTAWTRLGVHEINAPMSFHSRVKLDYPVSMGGYTHSPDPSQPIGLHMVHVPGAPNQGLDARDQFRMGRQTLLDMTFSDFETRIRDDLDRMLGPGGFSSARDVKAITVNRWSHGYAYGASTLFDKDYEATLARARAKAGHVAIANSDAAGQAYAHAAIDEAHRAVKELLG